jgi:hypothetical protein
MSKRVYDMFRNIIQPGDYIAYPQRKKSDTYSRTAKVLDVVERQLEGEKPQMILKVAMAKAPRAHERKGNEWPKTQIKNTVVSVTHRTIVVPKSYIQNDKRYACLLDV